MIRRGLMIGVVAAPMLFAGCRQDADTSPTSVVPTSTTTPADDSDSALAGAATATADSVTDTVPPATNAATAVSTTAAAEPDGAAGCAVAAINPGVSEIVVTGGGADHPVRVFVPSSFDGTTLPAVLNWHGLGSNGVEQAVYSGYEELAEEQSFLAVHPTGVGPAGGPTSWQLAADAAGVRDDVVFAAALIDVLVANWCAEPTRIRGESELVGDDVPPDLRALFDRSIRDEYEHFVVGDGCDTAALDTFVDSELVIHSYGGCDGDLTMALFEVTGGGHTWPGSPLRDVPGDPLGLTTGRVEATRDGWVYMREFSLP